MSDDGPRILVTDRLSTVDGLTQIFNKRYFVETLQRELDRARRYDRPLALVMVDIDRFAQCNFMHGHKAGDHVLRRVAELLQARAGRVDVVARYGGETFAVALPEGSSTDAAQFGEDVRKMIADEKFLFENQRILLTASVGVAALESTTANADELIATASARLSRAKQNGRNRVVIDDG